MSKTIILKIKGDWQEVLNDCRTTVGKDTVSKEPSHEFKTRILLAEHSPIRDISVKWRWNNIKSWVATHWSRHKWECYIQTQRTDRTGIERDDLPQSSPVNFTGMANTQALIDTMRKRLCHQASAETRRYAEDLKEAITELEPEIGNVLVPNCVYRAGCPEMKPCGYYQSLCEKSGCVESTDIALRYKVYNSLFEKERSNRGFKRRENRNCRS